MDEPIKASEIKAPDVDQEVKDENVARAVARARLARRDALRGMGAIGPSSEDLAAKLDDGMKRRSDDVMAEFRRKNGR